MHWLGFTMWRMITEHFVAVRQTSLPLSASITQFELSHYISDCLSVFFIVSLGSCMIDCQPQSCTFQKKTVQIRKRIRAQGVLLLLKVTLNEIHFSL